MIEHVRALGVVSLLRSLVEFLFGSFLIALAQPGNWHYFGSMETGLLHLRAAPQEGDQQLFLIVGWLLIGLSMARAIQSIFALLWFDWARKLGLVLGVFDVLLPITLPMAIWSLVVYRHQEARDYYRRHRKSVVDHFFLLAVLAIFRSLFELVFAYGCFAFAGAWSSEAGLFDIPWTREPIIESLLPIAGFVFSTLALARFAQTLLSILLRPSARLLGMYLAVGDVLIVGALLMVLWDPVISRHSETQWALVAFAIVTMLFTAWSIIAYRNAEIRDHLRSHRRNVADQIKALGILSLVRAAIEIVLCIVCFSTISEIKLSIFTDGAEGAVYWLQHLIGDESTIFWIQLVANGFLFLAFMRVTEFFFSYLVNVWARRLGLFLALIDVLLIVTWPLALIAYIIYGKEQARTYFVQHRRGVSEQVRVLGVLFILRSLVEIAAACVVLWLGISSSIMAEKIREVVQQLIESVSWIPGMEAKSALVTLGVIVLALGSLRLIQSVFSMTFREWSRRLGIALGALDILIVPPIALWSLVIYLHPETKDIFRRVRAEV